MNGDREHIQPQITTQIWAYDVKNEHIISSWIPIWLWRTEVSHCPHTVEGYEKGGLELLLRDWNDAIYYNLWRSVGTPAYHHLCVCLCLFGFLSLLCSLWLCSGSFSSFCVFKHQSFAQPECQIIPVLLPFSRLFLHSHPCFPDQFFISVSYAHTHLYYSYLIDVLSS